MRQYETGFLISPNISEEEMDQLILKMSDIVSKNRGKMLKEDRWGKRKLAYPIKKFNEAFYVFFHYEADPDVPFELERRFKQTDTILRFLTVKKTDKAGVSKGKKSRLKKQVKTKSREDKAENVLAEKDIQTDEETNEKEE